MISISLRRCLLAVVLAWPLGACPSVDLIKAENEWRETYRGMVESDAVLDDDFLATGTSSYQRQLKDLADRSMASAARVMPDDRAMAIGFYRIAALAGWKSHLSETSAIDPAVNAGKTACRAEAAKAPARDCSVFYFVSPFATHDLLAIELIQFKHKHPTNPLGAVDREAVATKVETLDGLFVKVSGLRKGTGPESDGLTQYLNQVPRSFHRTFVDQNWLGIYCTATFWVEMYAQRDPDTTVDNTPRLDAIARRTNEMRKVLTAELRAEPSCPGQPKGL